MRAYVGITDASWIRQVRLGELDEINFWQPGGRRQFRALEPGELFLFKLHSPNNFIVGGAHFMHSSILPISLAWKIYGKGNGVDSLQDMRERTLKYRREAVDKKSDFLVGCILLSSPFFFEEDLKIPVPADWKSNIVQGKRYDETTHEGKKLFDRLNILLRNHDAIGESLPRYGNSVLIAPRLGQAAFRVVVADAYGRRCAVTGEKTLPVLEAAHVKPYSEGGEHSLDNGLLLRSDFHTLFDRGYITVTPEMRIEVSSRLKDDFSNGKVYYERHGGVVKQPKDDDNRISSNYLSWHNENVYLG